MSNPALVFERTLHQGISQWHALYTEGHLIPSEKARLIRLLAPVRGLRPALGAHVVPEVLNQILTEYPASSIDLLIMELIQCETRNLQFNCFWLAETLISARKQWILKLTGENSLVKIPEDLLHPFLAQITNPFSSDPQALTIALTYFDLQLTDDRFISIAQAFCDHCPYIAPLVSFITSHSLELDVNFILVLSRILGPANETRHDFPRSAQSIGHYMKVLEKRCERERENSSSTVTRYELLLEEYWAYITTAYKDSVARLSASQRQHHVQSTLANTPSEPAAEPQTDVESKMDDQTPSASTPIDPTPTPIDPIPASADPTPASADPTPASADPTPASADPTPASADPTPIEPAATEKVSQPKSEQLSYVAKHIVSAYKNIFKIAGKPLPTTDANPDALLASSMGSLGWLVKSGPFADALEYHCRGNPTLIKRALALLEAAGREPEKEYFAMRAGYVPATPVPTASPDSQDMQGSVTSSESQSLPASLASLQDRPTSLSPPPAIRDLYAGLIEGTKWLALTPDVEIYDISTPSELHRTLSILKDWVPSYQSLVLALLDTPQYFTPVTPTPPTSEPEFKEPTLENSLADGAESDSQSMPLPLLAQKLYSKESIPFDTPITALAPLPPPIPPATAAALQAPLGTDESAYLLGAEFIDELQKQITNKALERLREVGSNSAEAHLLLASHGFLTNPTTHNSESMPSHGDVAEVGEEAPTPTRLIATSNSVPMTPRWPLTKPASVSSHGTPTQLVASQITSSSSDILKKYGIEVVVGVDTEQGYSAGGRGSLALIQIAAGNKVVLIHPQTACCVALEYFLAALISDPKVLKVGQAFSGDLGIIRSMFPTRKLFQAPASVLCLGRLDNAMLNRRVVALRQRFQSVQRLADKISAQLIQEQQSNSVEAAAIMQTDTNNAEMDPLSLTVDMDEEDNAPQLNTSVTSTDTDDIKVEALDCVQAAMESVLDVVSTPADQVNQQPLSSSSPDVLLSSPGEIPVESLGLDTSLEPTTPATPLPASDQVATMSNRGALRAALAEVRAARKQAKADKRRSTTTAARRPIRSLARVCETYFGLPLFKEPCVSVWQRNPLRAYQIAYAALDAWIEPLLLERMLGFATSDEFEYGLESPAQIQPQVLVLPEAREAHQTDE